jgi:hypothetical protein
MAIQTRYAGDSLPVVNVDNFTGTTGTIVSTGLTKNPVALKVVLGNSQNFSAAEMATGGAVETILRSIAIDSTIVMYQVESTGGQMSVLLEALGSSASAIQTRIQSIGGNIGVASNVWAGGGVTVTNTGFKLA